MKGQTKACVCDWALGLTVHAVLLTVPPQTHGDEGQEDEHHDGEHTAHDHRQEAPGGGGGLGGIGPRGSDGVLAGETRGLAGWAATEMDFTWTPG